MLTAICTSTSGGPETTTNATADTQLNLQHSRPMSFSHPLVRRLWHCNRCTSTVPIVFVVVADPVGAAFVDSMARPGGRIAGFTQFEYGISAKWLELLKEIASRSTRVAVLRNPTIASGSGQLGALPTVAPSLGVELRPVDVRNAEEIERADRLRSYADLLMASS